MLPHSSYSPDIALSGYHLFRAMQSVIIGKRFTSYESIANWLNKWIEWKELEFFVKGIRMLPERCGKVAASK